MPLSGLKTLPDSKTRDTGRRASRQGLGHTKEKSEGIHYTPPELAAFLAGHVVNGLNQHAAAKAVINVLDPACGDGELLKAVAEALAPDLRSKVVLHGFDKDEQALERANQALHGLGVQEVRLQHADFLSVMSGCAAKPQMNLSFDFSTAGEFALEGMFDAVISNPPYVRTQVLGADIARQLAEQFDLTGRVDLYHAFVKAMTLALREGGILGLLTSNRFLFIRSGESTRQWLLKHFRLTRLFDLGDTKLFQAAVLPAIVVAERRETGSSEDCEFVRVYEDTQATAAQARPFGSILGALDGSFSGVATVHNEQFRVETGRLNAPLDCRTPWSMVSDEVDAWLAAVQRNSAATFCDVGKVSVGIKTTADSVFIRDDWETLTENERPEEALLRPLITHHLASRWNRLPNGDRVKRVLYPYTVINGRRQPVDLNDFPRTKAYLERHRSALEGRTYVTESGREWYEIWVARHPDDWLLPKIVFPDISASNDFFFADDGWVVNGDCYWIKLLPKAKQDWLWLMLAVANSSFILKYYDVMFHNKLYSGRRRFMSQYVEGFPLPKLEESGEILEVVSRLMQAAKAGRQTEVRQLEQIADDLVWKAFGLRKEIAR